MQIIDELSQLDDAALHGALKHTTGKANTLTAQLLAQLGELEERGLYRERACSSLYTYCVYELRMSEDEAQRRCRAARLARQFPVLLQMLANAAIHLTVILLLGPHLTAENHAELLARARHRTKREIEQLVATVAPRADVPALVVPLRRAGAEPIIEQLEAGAGGRTRDTWAAFVQALAGPIRQLKAGVGAGKAPPGALADDGAPVSAEEEVSAAPPSPGGMRYQVQFTADQAYVDLLEEARDLLQHQYPDRNLVEAHRRALQLLVEQLRQRKHAATRRARGSAPRASSPLPSEAAAADAATASAQVAPVAAAGTQISRHLPAALRREVWQRAGGRCAYTDERGVRCRETAGLEFHHHVPFACGGPSTAENVALRCRAHNALAAERDFGPRHMARFRQRENGHRASAVPPGAASALAGGGAVPPSG